MTTPKTKLPMKDALLVKTAEMWLRLGEPCQALMELQRLTKRAWKHPWVESVFWRAAQGVS